jgi:hypothetical protein
MTPRQWGLAATATAAMLVPALLHGVGPIDWSTAAGPSEVEAVPPGPGDVLGTMALKDDGTLGATGRLPETDELSAALLAEADDPSDFEDDLPPLDGGFLREGQSGIPGVMLDAYMRAAERLAQTTPGCKLDWPLVASIGRIESGHAHGGRVDSNGDTAEPILGPVLNGAPGVAAIPDTDDGRFDRDGTWDRAVGPMQFIPSTWSGGYAADGNEDGVRDPNNIYDATIGAGNYLCAYGANVSDPVQRAQSVFRYNHSNEYVATVLYWADAYAKGVTPLPDLVGSDDDFGPEPGTGTPPNNTAPPGNTAPPSSGTSTPPTTTTTTSRSGVTISITPTVPSSSTTVTTTPTCPTPTTDTTTTTPTTPTTTPTIPPGCPTPTTTSTSDPSTSAQTSAQTSAETSVQTTVPGSTSGDAGSSAPPSVTSSMRAT